MIKQNKAKSRLILPRRRIWFLIAFLGFVLIVLGARLWLPFIGRWLVVEDSPSPADVIIPLAGGASRVRYAAALYHEGYADTVAATNAPIDIPGINEPYVELVQRELLDRGVPDTQIVKADELILTTEEEAQVIQRLAQDHGWRSLLIVTSPFHTRRSRFIFDEVMHDSGIAVQVVPVRPDPYDGDRWWESVDGMRFTTQEYLKFLAHVAGYR